MRRKTICLSIAMMAAAVAFAQQTVTVTLKNNLKCELNDVPATVSLKEWPDTKSATVVADGKEIPYQIDDLDKDGNPTLASSIEQYTYRQLVNDIKRSEQPDREPTEIEMILACQMVKARFDTQAAIFVRDTLGAKPVDESKMDATLSANQYEQLTDEELELLAAHRAKKAADDQRSPAEASSSLVKPEDKHA